jgi:hypothetical protein
MNTFEINNILTKNPITKIIFCGVFAIDNLPKESKDLVLLLLILKSQLKEDRIGLQYLFQELVQ